MIDTIRHNKIMAARRKYLLAGHCKTILEAIELYNQNDLPAGEKILPLKAQGIQKNEPATGAISAPRPDAEECPLCKKEMKYFPPCCTSKIARFKCSCGYSRNVKT